VHGPSDAVPPELVINRVSVLGRDGADCRGDVADAVAGLGGGNPGGEGLLGGTDQGHVRGIGAPDDNGDCGIRYPPVHRGGEVEAEDVAIAQPVVVRQPMLCGIASAPRLRSGGKGKPQVHDAAASDSG
jgi:hypothetical protein